MWRFNILSWYLVSYTVYSYLWTSVLFSPGKLFITTGFVNNVGHWYGIVYERWSAWTISKAKMLWVLLSLLKKGGKKEKKKEQRRKINTKTPASTLLRALRVQVHDLTPNPTYSLPLALKMVTLFSCVRLCGQNHCGIVWLCALLCLGLLDRQKASSDREKGKERMRKKERETAVMKRSQGLGGVPMPSIPWMDDLL